MLLYSSDDGAHNATIHVFAGIPASIVNASFYHLRAAGAILVSAERVNAVTTFVAVQAMVTGCVACLLSSAVPTSLDAVVLPWSQISSSFSREKAVYITHLFIQLRSSCRPLGLRVQL